MWSSPFSIEIYHPFSDDFNFIPHLLKKYGGKIIALLVVIFFCFRSHTILYIFINICQKL